MMMSEAKSFTIPGKECGVHAGYDAGGELIYIGMGEMRMHRSVIEKIEAEWDKVFGDGKGQQGLGQLPPGDQQ
jgi:hypothetical protein